MPFDFSFACPDWEEKLKHGETPVPEIPVDKTKADRAVAIFDRLRLPDVPGQPTFAEAGGDWFRDIIRPTFGAYHPETGDRLVGELFILVPKKNSKTTNSAALGITALCVNTTRNIEMLIIGPTQDVADTCFNQARGMIEADPDLSKLFHIQDHLKKITHRITKAVLRIKTFDMRVVTGTIPALVILDELHVLAGSSYASKVIGQIRGGMITNPEALLVIITTQSVDPPAGVFKSELQYARGVRDGRITENVRTLAVLYEFPESVQRDESKPWRDQRIWSQVLPNLGRSITIPRLAAIYQAAMEKGPEEEALWASQHLNIEIGMGLHTDRWVGVDFWPSAGRKDMTLDSIMATSDVCVVGVDGGGLDDLLGFGVLGRRRRMSESEPVIWQHWGKAWADPQVLLRRKSIAERLRDFEADGDLVFCENGTDDIGEIADICRELNDAGLLPDQNAIGLDPEGVAAIIDALIGVGLTEDQLAAVSQGYKLNAAIKGAPRKLKNRTLVHCAQPMMSWCVSNARTEMRGNAQIVTKQISGAGKIDPLMGLFNAFMLMSWNPVPSSRRNMDGYFAALEGAA